MTQFPICIFLFASLFYLSNCTNDQKEKSPTDPVVIEDTPKDQPDTVKKSIPTFAQKFINGTDVIINYHSPGVKNRVIWGGLVPYNEVWVTGANQATSLSIGRNFIAGGKNLSAGKYALFTIPGKEVWTIILNKNWDQHLADEYDAKDDVVRIKIKPQSTNHFQERLKYEIDQIGERWANIIISWETLQVKFDIRLEH